MKASVEDFDGSSFSIKPSEIVLKRELILSLMHFLFYSCIFFLISAAPLIVAYGQPEVSSTIKSFDPAPSGIKYDPVHEALYVTSERTGSVSVIDANTNTVVGSPIIVGNNPQGIAHDPVHDRMYVTNFGSNSVSVIDTNTNTVVGGDIKIASPLAIEYDLLNANLYVISIKDDTVSAIDSTSNKFVGDPVYTGSNPRGLSLDYKNGKMFTTNHANGTISAIQISPLHTLMTSAFDGNNGQLSHRDQTTSTEITFAFSASANHPTSLHEYQCTVDSSSFSKCSSPITYKDLEANRTHTFKVRAIDELGNVETPPMEFTWMIISPLLSAGRIGDICMDSMSHKDKINLGLNTNPMLEVSEYDSYFEGGCSLNRFSDVIQDGDNPIANDNQRINDTYREITVPGYLNDNTLALSKEQDMIITKQSENDITLCQEGTQQVSRINETTKMMTAYCEGGKNADLLDPLERKHPHTPGSDTISRLEGRFDGDKSLTGNIPLALPY